MPHEMPSPSKAPADPLSSVLSRFWGFREFLPLQREAMEAVLAGRDSLLVLPTGGGKSLCFQAPSLVGEGLAVVVSPLISLMKDQVDGLVTDGVPAACFNSSLPPEERQAVRRGILDGSYRLLYVSPERLAGESSEEFLELLERAAVRYFAIDEAHCISQWGHNFRPEYRRLGELRQRFPDVSLHAFTATATEQVRRDIVEQLGLRQPDVLVGAFDRPNLVYRARRRGDLAGELRRIVDRHSGEAGIVYCISRKEVDRWAARLAEWGYSALPYHAGLSPEERDRNQEAFLGERADIIVATVAFGMGIDRSDVRFVVHAGAPRSVEHYQQESGRAGRDGLEAECVLFYSPGDFITWRRLMESSNELSEGSRRLLSEMQRYAGTLRCRHRALVEHFGQTYEEESCGACDWCLGELEEVEGALVLAQKILSCVLRLEQRFGVGQVVDVLRGRETDKVLSRRHNEVSTFGLLADHPPGELRAYVGQLQDQGFLATSGGTYPTLEVTPEGWKMLRAETECRLYRQHRPKKAKPKPRRAAGREESWEGVNRDLFEALRELRREIAAERGVPPYVIFHDSMLRDLARVRPASPETMLEVYGVGEKKAADFGPQFLEVIDAHCAQRGLERDVLGGRDGRLAFDR